MWRLAGAWPGRIPYSAFINQGLEPRRDGLFVSSLAAEVGGDLLPGEVEHLRIGASITSSHAGSMSQGRSGSHRDPWDQGHLQRPMCLGELRAAVSAQPPLPYSVVQSPPANRRVAASARVRR
jgi:hypothetical protein